MFGNPETTTGGRALKFYSSVRVDIRRIAAIKDGEAVVGNRTKVKVVKNKVASPFREAEFDIIYGEGISKEGDLIDLGVAQNIIEKSGSWFSYKGERIGQGRENARQFLKDNPDIRQAIDLELRKALGLIKLEAAPEPAAVAEAPVARPAVAAISALQRARRRDIPGLSPRLRLCGELSHMTERERQRAIQLKLARSESRNASAASPLAFPRSTARSRADCPAASSPSLRRSLVRQDHVGAIHGGARAAKRPVARRGSTRNTSSIRPTRLGRASVWNGCRWRGADTAEESLEIARRLAESGGIDLLALDSAAALTPAIELEIGFGESGPGLQGASSGVRISPFGLRGGQNRNGHSCFESNT